MSKVLAFCAGSNGISRIISNSEDTQSEICAREILAYVDETIQHTGSIYDIEKYNGTLVFYTGARHFFIDLPLHTSLLKGPALTPNFLRLLFRCSKYEHGGIADVVGGFDRRDFPFIDDCFTNAIIPVAEDDSDLQDLLDIPDPFILPDINYSLNSSDDSAQLPSVDIGNKV